MEADNGSGVSGQRAHSRRVASLAIKVRVQRIAAVTFDLRTQLHAAILASVAVDVEALVHRHHTHRLTVAFGLWHDRLRTDGAARSELIVEARDAVDVVGRVDGERDAVERCVAHDARETERVEGLARSAQQLLRDCLAALGALFKRVHVVDLTIGLPFQRIERTAGQFFAALAAIEASQMERLV